MTMLTSALQYYDAGIQIAGCQNRTKLLAQSSFADRAAVEAFFTTNPEANLAILTGAPNNLLVVDVDPIRGPNPNAQGFEAWDAFQAEYGTLPTTTKCNTPRGGFHLYYRIAADANVTRPRIGTGIDLRGATNYVLAPPSQNGNGQAYTWETQSIIATLGTIPSAPSWLVELGTDQYPESWPVPEFTTPYHRDCWTFAMQAHENASGKKRGDFDAGDWSAVQTVFEAALARASWTDGRRYNRIEETTTAVDSVTVTTA
ncbi:MAG: hypothetical protein GWN58_33970 [Anaerolineae bacterium]|nr:bifunctional DNA primase/polymerase [Thermoplasmata archaeon]NIV34287.1 hypothetical protein [Anaerolineae bacterium]NIY06136.1 hypothetical protein [Thermoplasmata archaeon]